MNLQSLAFHQFSALLKYTRLRSTPLDFVSFIVQTCPICRPFLVFLIVHGVCEGYYEDIPISQDEIREIVLKSTRIVTVSTAKPRLRSCTAQLHPTLHFFRNVASPSTSNHLI